MSCTGRGFHGASSEIDLEIFFDPFKLDRLAEGGGCGSRVDGGSIVRLSADNDLCCAVAGRLVISAVGISATAAACRNTDRFDMLVLRLTAD